MTLSKSSTSLNLSFLVHRTKWEKGYIKLSTNKNSKKEIKEGGVMKLPVARREWNEILHISRSGTGRSLNAHVSVRTGAQVSDRRSGTSSALWALASPSAEPGFVLSLPRVGMRSSSPGGGHFAVGEINWPLGLSRTQRGLLASVLQFSTCVDSVPGG